MLNARFLVEVDSISSDDDSAVDGDRRLLQELVERGVSDAG